MNARRAVAGAVMAALTLAGTAGRAADSDTYIARGKDCVAMGAFADGEKEFRKAVELGGDQPEALYGAGFCAFRQGKTKRAATDFEQVLKSTHSVPQYRGFHTLALLRLGEIKLSQRNFREAIDIYAGGVNNEASNADFRYGLGTALRGLGRNEKALNSFEEALKINPSHAGALVGKAAIYYDLGNVPEAFDLLERAIKLDPQSALPYGVMGALYRDLKKPYEENLMIGQYYFYSGDLKRAIGRFRAALVVNETSQVHHAIGSVLLKDGQAAESVRHFERALKLKVRPEDPALAQLSMAYAKMGKLTEAKSLIAKAIRQNGRSAEYHGQNAWILLLAKDSMGAEKEARAALKLDPENAGAYRYLGDSLNSRGLARDAVDAYEKCLARNPGLSDVYVNLGWAYEQLGDLVSAQRNYETFLRGGPPPDEAKSVKAHIDSLRKRSRK